MRASSLDRGQIRVAGAVDGAAIGLLDEPVLPQPDGTFHVVFIPLDRQIGTTTIVQRLCGSDSIDPHPSAGINAYRAVWSLDMDQIGSVRYHSLFLWDVCYEIQDRCPSLVENYLQSANVIVFVVGSGQRDPVETLIQNYQNNIPQSQKVVICISQCDCIESAKIRPSDAERLSSAFNAAVVQVSNAHKPVSSKSQPSDSIRKLVRAIADNLPRRG